MGKTVSVWATMVVGGVVAFYATGLSLGKPKTGDEANRNFCIALCVALVVLLIPRVGVWLLDKQRNTDAWKVWLLVFLALVISGAMSVLMGGDFLMGGD